MTGFAATHTGSLTPSSEGDVISVRCVGSSIEVFRNGASVLTSTRTEHQTATKQGLIQNGSGNKWDDFLVTPP